MAVFQISKIQIRRGKKDSLPQLASGEMGWAIDDRQLFIGNGSVSEGAPMVGNTKILTEHDLSESFVQSIQYSFTPGAEEGSLQSKLGETISTSDFGSKGNGITDNSTILQTAINTLFTNQNAPADGTGSDNVKARVTLEIPPGIYLITQTLLIPSYATIVGAGIDKTIFKYSGIDAAFKTVDGVLTRNILISDLTILSETNTDTLSLLTLKSTDSEFRNLKLVGIKDDILLPDGLTDDNGTPESIGISLLANSQNNIFENIKISNLAYGIKSSSTISNIRINNSYILNVGNGIMLTGAPGPNNISITNCNFENIVGYGIWLSGTTNYINDCNIKNVGNGELEVAFCPQIFLLNSGNICSNIYSDRSNTLGNTDQYYPEIAGSGEYTSSIRSITSLPNTIRLPYNIDSSFALKPVLYKITYTCRSNTTFITGTATICANVGSDLPVENDYTVSGSDLISAEFTVSVEYNSIKVAIDGVDEITYQYTAIF